MNVKDGTTEDRLSALIRALYLSGIEDEPDYWGRTGGDEQARAEWEQRIVKEWLPKFLTASSQPTPTEGGPQ